MYSLKIRFPARVARKPVQLLPQEVQMMAMAVWNTDNVILHALTNYNNS
jgi:hypothetical protein